MKEKSPYNPLDKRSLGSSVADALLEREAASLPLETPFVGAGIYAIYYTGEFPLYEPVARRNRRRRFSWPIYVGKAIPHGARQGGVGLGADPGSVLFGRIREHSRSIEQAGNLDVADFFCRYLVVEDIWIPLGESLLIEMFAPVWNVVVDGFGNHDPGSGRYNQQRSPWDVLHPGRRWALNCAPNERGVEDMVAAVEQFLAQHKTR